jgi:hypothetical protein
MLSGGDKIKMNNRPNDALNRDSAGCVTKRMLKRRRVAMGFLLSFYVHLT